MPEVKESKRLQAKRAEAAKRQAEPPKQTTIQMLQKRIGQLAKDTNTDPAVLTLLKEKLRELMAKNDPAAALAHDEAQKKRKLAEKTQAYRQ
jgi:hypothetical protein